MLPSQGSSPGSSPGGRTFFFPSAPFRCGRGFESASSNSVEGWNKLALSALIPCTVHVLQRSNAKEELCTHS
jgi:hypothetical protein